MPGSPSNRSPNAALEWKLGTLAPRSIAGVPAKLEWAVAPDFSRIRPDDNLIRMPLESDDPLQEHRESAKPHVSNRVANVVPLEVFQALPKRICTYIWTDPSEFAQFSRLPKRKDCGCLPRMKKGYLTLLDVGENLWQSGRVLARLRDYFASNAERGCPGAHSI